MATADTTSKTVRTNTQAIYAKFQTEAAKIDTRNKANLIPISPEISKTFLEDNSIERPELRGGFGANDSVIISQTQGVSIPTFIQCGGLNSGKKSPKEPPVDPLLCACFHQKKFVKKDGTLADEVGDDTIYVRYTPTDDDVFGATLLYKIDDIEQEMVSAKGTMSLSIEVGSFATMTYEMQSPYTAPVSNTDAVSGTANKFQPTLAVSGQNTLKVPNLPEEFANCVRSFSLSQNATISAIDCATREGDRKITYTQTGRAATGEIVVDAQAADVDSKGGIEKLAKAWGGQKPLKSDYKLADGTGGLIQLGTEAGNIFVVAANNYKIGAPTLGDSDGIATWTFPITFIPVGGEPDYELYYVGNTK